MSKDKCCGNCKHFKDEDTRGEGWCEEHFWVTECSKVCKCHEYNCNGWTEISPDNVDEVDLLRKDRFVDVLDSRTMIVKNVDDYHCSLSTMVKQGGYYYYVLPELKIE